MNQLIKIIVCCVFALQLQAQQRITTLSNIKNTSKTATSWQVYKKATAQTAQQLAKNKAALSLNNDDALHLINERKDKVGLRHYRYQQKYKGIPIEGAIYLMHERAGKVELSNGRLVHDLNIATQPSISIQQAKQIALQAVECDQPEHQQAKNKTGLTEKTIKKISTVILDPQFTFSPSNYHLTYKVELRDLHSFIFKDVFVDAHNGNILLSLDKIHHCTDIDASGSTNYSGNVNFTACQTNDNTYALKSSIGDMGSLEVQRYGIPFSTLITDAEPTFGDTQTANEVMWASQKTFDYFFNAHQHPYPDTLTKCVVHYTKNESLSNDAFYADGIGVFFGDGDRINYNSPTSVDIVAHELSHGLTNFTADLIYVGQPGALSESFSDIFGEMVENEIKPNGNDWIIGAEVLTQQSGKNGMRSMSNPKDDGMKYKLPDTYLGENWKNLPKDNEGVHYNCGVHNYWFYLLSEGNTGINDNGYIYNVEGIGKENAAAIAYRNLTYYLTPTSHYEDAKLGSIQAAKDLFSDNSNEVNQVIEAWNAVGLPDCKTSDTTALMTLARSSQFYDWREDTEGSYDLPFNWKENIPVENWNGITTNEEGCVTKIDLSNKEFIGTVSSIFGSLKQLDMLNLQNNNLVGRIPASLGNLANLETLLLNNNALKGSLPGTFQYLESLKHIDVSNNQLEGCFEAPLDSLCKMLGLTANIDDGNQFKVDWETFCEGYGCRECRLVDSLSLLKVYEATDGANWINTWNLNEPITDWFGVTFDENDCVEGLHLSDNNLSGSIPAEIGDLYSLHYMYLDSNRLQGSVPYELININNIIYIDLSYNLLSGCYNANLNDMNIKWDDAFICNNKISDGNFFDASWCDFYFSNAGNCDNYLPMECRQRDSIALLALHQTTNGANWKNTWNLNESIDQWDGITLNSQGCVTNLKIENNFLDGFIPNHIGYLSELRNLSFLNNSLSGIIPKNIGQLSKLNTLKLNYNNLSGSLPASLGNLNNLTYFWTYANQLTGEIPPALSNMSKLRILSLHDNQLTGTIPIEFGSMNSLTHLSLSENNLTGSIPFELGNMSNLKSLSIDQNQLSGGIPSNIGNLTNLSTLKLNDNNLLGCYHPDLNTLCTQLAINNYSNISDNNNFEATWDDFCSSSAGLCISPVLPGDFNADGMVNYNDLLYWGLASGNTGPARNFASTDWAPQNASDWNETIQGINGKHQDANGDGIVDEADLTAFELNYGATTYNVNPLVNANRTFAFTIEVTDFAQNDFTFDLRMHSLTGSDSIDVHGLSMSLNFSEFIVNDILIDDSRSVIPSNQLKTFYNRETETLDVSMTKVDRKNFKVKNNDVVLSIKGCIQVDDLPGGDPPAINLEGGGLLNKDGEFKSIGNITLLPYFLTDENEGSFPSTIPVAVTILPHSCENLGAIYINTIEGQGLPPYTYSWSNGSETSFIDHLQAGSYQVVVSDDSGRSQNLKLNVEDKQVNCSESNNCLELLDLNDEIEDGIYQAQYIYFNGTVVNQNGVHLKASNRITLDVGTQIENITINIEDCE